MPNNLPTEAGRSEPEQKHKLAKIDALNQVFTLFRLNFHNQYLKAFGNREELNEVKRLWLDMLQRFSAETILRGARTIIENSDYLPTLHTMIHACERAATRGVLPDVHQAYIEACRAPSPKAAFRWSHPIVYHAGRRSDWYFLQSSSEAVAYPVFKKHFEDLLIDLRAGIPLSEPNAPALTEVPAATPIDRGTSRERLERLRQNLDL